MVSPRRHLVIAVAVWAVLSAVLMLLVAGIQVLPAIASNEARIQDHAFVLLTVVLFVMTGSYLLVTDDQYQGLGDFGSTWAQLMLVKHVLVVALVALGAVVDWLVRDAAAATSPDARATALHRLRLATEGATVVGALIALLTAASQAV